MTDDPRDYLHELDARVRLLEQVRADRERIGRAVYGHQPCRLVEYLGGSARTLPRVFPDPDTAETAARNMFANLQPGRSPQRILVVELAGGETLRTLTRSDPLEGGPF